MRKEGEDLKLNMGSGHEYLETWENVDKNPERKPDVVWDLEKFPWPWESNSVGEIHFKNSLEKMGRDLETYLNIWKEIWRISKNGAKLHIFSPHWRHDLFISDPANIRPITPLSVAMFDQKRNDEILRLSKKPLRAEKESMMETPYGIENKIDFIVMDTQYVLAEPWLTMSNSKQIPNDQMTQVFNSQMNVCKQIHIIAHVVKPARITGNQ